MGLLSALPLLVATARAAAPAACTPALNISYAIPYYSGLVNCGTLFQKADIARPPTVKFPADASKLYTLLYVSTCSHCNNSWPDSALEDGDVHIHYAAANIPSALLATGDVSQDDQWHYTE